MPRTVLLLLLALFLAACGGSTGPIVTPTPFAAEPSEPAEPTEPDEEIVRQITPQGEAAVQLVVEPREIRLEETVTIRLVNRGRLPLRTGFMFNIERWDGERWVEVPWPENVDFPAAELFLPVGGSTEPQSWPYGGVSAQPGLYRAIKSASYPDPDQIRPDLQLRPRTRFRVRRSGEPSD
ncbi:MAG: immunoglobulin-like domain-containing protein [Nitriliruptorales bacterium]